MNAFGALFERLFERRERGPRAPGHRKRRKVEIAHRLAVADHQRYRLAAEARDALREHRLVGERRDNAIAIRAGDILGGEDGDDSGMSALKRLDVAENERGVRVRRSDRARRQRLGRPFVSAEDFRSRRACERRRGGGRAARPRRSTGDSATSRAPKLCASFTASRMAR